MASGLLGFRSQSMGGPKTGYADPFPLKLSVEPTSVGASGTFTAAKSGRYMFILHGSGGAGITSGVRYPGGPGGLAIRTVNMLAGQTVDYFAAGSGASSSVSFTDTTMQVTAGAAASGAPGGVGGVATGGDINVNGTQGATTAASYGDITGGTGQSATSGNTAGAPGIGNEGTSGGPGRLLVVFVANV